MHRAATERAALKWGQAGSFEGRMAASEQAKAAKRLRYIWLDRIKADPKLAEYECVNRFLIAALATELATNFSSFRGKGVFASYKNLAGRLRVSERQVRRAVFALRDQKYLAVKRRGCGSTNLIVPHLEGTWLYDLTGLKRPDGVALKGRTEWPKKASQFEQKHAASHSKHDEISSGNVAQSSKALVLNSCSPLPLNPPSAESREEQSASPKTATGLSEELSAATIPILATTDVERPASGQSIGAEGDSGADDIVHGEVLDPGSELTFGAFWNATRSGSADKDPPGPARVYWQNSLSPADKDAIAAVLARDGVNLAMMWTVTWLRYGCWKEEPLQRSGTRGIMDAVRDLANGNRPFSSFLTIGDDPGVAGVARVAARRDAQRAASEQQTAKPALPHYVLDRVWYRLGDGDVDRGYELWKPLDQSTKDKLKEHERAGTLDPELAVRIATGAAS